MGNLLLCTLSGILAIQSYIAILAFDVNGSTPARRSLAKALIIVVTATIWGIVLTTFDDRVSSAIPGVLLGMPVVVFISRRLPWTRADLLPYEFRTKHFCIYTDLDPKATRFYADFFEGLTTYFQQTYFSFQQKQPLTVYLFSTKLRYEFFNRKSKGPATSVGYYCGPRANLIVVNLASGLGTATHELVHHFIAQGFFGERCPQWVNEGLAMFFEKFIAHFDSQGQLTISLGYFSDWRFPQTKRLIGRITGKDLFDYKHASPTRDFMLFLHRKGLLKEFIDQLRARWGDATGKGTLQKVYGKGLALIISEWKDWVRSQPIDGNVRFVRKSFVKSCTDWEAWQRANKDKIHWDEQLKVYVVGKPSASKLKAV